MSMLTLASAAGELLWAEWDDVYAVYQPSSTETHLFNETTALILKALKAGPSSQEGVKEWVSSALGLEENSLFSKDLEMALGRLEVLGLIEWQDGGAAAGP